MPPGEGWFIDLETGEGFRIFEHARAVVAEPERFRIHPCEIEGMSTPRDRVRILSLALSRGFVRVRADKGRVVLEYEHPDTERVRATMLRFLSAQGFADHAEIRVNRLGRPEDGFHGRLRDFPA